MTKSLHNVDPNTFGGCGGRPPDGYDSGENPSKDGESDSPKCLDGASIGVQIGYHSSGLVNMEGVEQTAAMNDSMQNRVDQIVVEDTEILMESTLTSVDQRKVSYAAMAAKRTGAVDGSSCGGVLDNNNDVCSVGINNPDAMQPIGNDKTTTSLSTSNKSDLSGPWMVAEPWRRRTMHLNRAETTKDNTSKMGGGSRFAILTDSGNIEESPGKDVTNVTATINVPPATKKVVRTSSQGSKVPKWSVGSSTAVTPSAAHVASSSGKEKSGIVSKALKSINVVPIVENQGVEIIQHRGKIDNACTYVGKGLKEGGKQGLQIRKMLELRSSPKVPVTEWMNKLAQQLQKVVQQNSVVNFKPVGEGTSSTIMEPVMVEDSQPGNGSLGLLGEGVVEGSA
ncbi:hypothetical protein V6N13_050670 [Hibiscus sabdariffa]